LLLLLTEILAHHPKKTFSHKNGLPSPGKEILIPESPVNGEKCEKISSLVHEMDVANTAEMVGAFSSLAE